MSDPSEIQEIINYNRQLVSECKDDKEKYKFLLLINIYEKLKYINIEALQFINQTQGSRKQRYRALQKTDIWKRAKRLHIQYYRVKDGALYCHRCKHLIINKIPILHHLDFYNDRELFTVDLYTCLLCSKRCHASYHREVKI